MAKTSAMVLVLLALALTARAFSRSQDHLFPIYDEVGYMDIARDFAAKGGVLPTAACFLRGECREDNHHPLYTLILSKFVPVSPLGDFARGKLLSWVCALALIFVVFFMSRRLWGDSVALVAAAVALSPITTHVAYWVLVDGLFAVFYFAAIACLAAPKKTERTWIAFGLLAGLAHLTKGNGYFLFFSAVACGLYRYGKDFVRRREIYLALGAFAAVASFLLIRNVRVWGNPLHNLNDRFVFMGNWNDYFRLRDSPEWNQVGLLWFLKRHAVSELFFRLLEGAKLAAMSIPMIMAFDSGPVPPPSMPVLGIASALLALYGLWIRWNENAQEEVIAISATGAFLLAAYSIIPSGVAVNVRYEYPIAVTLMPVAALGGKSLVLRSWKKFSAERGRAALAAVVAIAALVAIYSDRRGLVVNPLGLAAVPAGWHETSQWLCGHENAAGYLDSFRSLYSTWDVCADRSHSYPFSVADEELRAEMSRRKIGLALLDTKAPSTGNPPGRLGPSDEFGPRSFLGWPRCFHDSEKPSSFLVYGVSCRFPFR